MSENNTEASPQTPLRRAQAQALLARNIGHIVEDTAAMIEESGATMSSFEQSRWSLVLIQLRTAYNHARAMSELAAADTKKAPEP